MTVLQTLTAARNLLLNDGWCVGKLRDEQGRHCAVGAVCEIVYPSDGCWLDWLHLYSGNQDLWDALALLANHVPEDPRVMRSPWNRVAYYNNGNDLIDVLALFDAAIRDAEKLELIEEAADDLDALTV